MEKTKIHEYLPDWSEQLAKRGIALSGYVLMPNHLHLLVFVQPECQGLNKVIGESKRFMAYEIVKRLKERNELELLHQLSLGVQLEEAKKGKRHQVFRLSFDAKELSSDEEVERVLDYIHHNPVSGKWNLAADFVSYPYSSARYYELGESSALLLRHYKKI